MCGVSVGSVVFGWAQNTFHPVGGPISIPKILWLNLALLVFFVVPLWLWSDPAVERRLRALFGWVLLSFALRAPVELYILYQTRLWRCEYGIAHDLFVFLLAGWLAWRRRDPGAGRTARDRAAAAFVPLLQLTLVVEMFMAWEFNRIASPAEGTYFAAPTPEFHFVNLASWIAVAVLYPALGWLVWKSRPYETV